MRSGLFLIACGLAAAGCNRGEVPRDGSSTPVPTPTAMVDSTRTEGLSITFEELERAIVGRWRLEPGYNDPQLAQEFHFFPNGVWVTPTYKGYGGKFRFVDSRTLWVRQDTSDTEVTFGFTLIGDELTLYYKDIPARYSRIRLMTPTPEA